MAKEHYPSIFQLSRDEKLMSPSNGETIVRTARFLKPCVQNISEAVTVPNTPLLFEIFSQNLKQWPENVDLKGWYAPQKHWEVWVDRMARKHGASWNLTGIRDAIMSSRYEIRSNKDLIMGLVEFWCPETNTFVFPWGEATVTLEDVMILGGFSTLGESVRKPLEGELVKIEEDMNNKRLIMSRNNSRKVTHACWIKHFMEEETEHEHVALLSLWLSRYVFPSLPDKIVSKQVLPVAIHLSSNTRIALAPAVLASLYKNLTLLKHQAMSSCQGFTVSGPFQLLQIWAFERFPSLGPSIPHTLKPGEPRIALYHKLNAQITLPLVRSVLRLSDNFRWRPYISELKNWVYPSFYKEENRFLAFDYNDPDEGLRSFARCLCASMLVGIDSVEGYLPQWVAMQFGYDQDLPAAIPVSIISWENVLFAVPPRSFKPCESVRYYSWRIRSMSARKAALIEMKTNQNESSPSAMAKRNTESINPSTELCVQKQRALSSKVPIKAEAEGCSKFAYEDPPAMCCSDKNSKEILFSVDPEFSVEEKRLACENYSDTIDHIPLSERLENVSSSPNTRKGFPKASKSCQLQKTNVPTSRVPAGNLRKRKFSTIAGRSKPTIAESCPQRAGGYDQKLKNITKEGRNPFDHAVRERVEQNKRFEGSLEESKSRMAEGFGKNSKNVAFKDTNSGSIHNFGLELEGRLRRLEKLAGVNLE